MTIHELGLLSVAYNGGFCRTLPDSTATTCIQNLFRCIKAAQSTISTAASMPTVILQRLPVTDISQTILSVFYLFRLLTRAVIPQWDVACTTQTVQFEALLTSLSGAFRACTNYHEGADARARNLFSRLPMILDDTKEAYGIARDFALETTPYGPAHSAFMLDRRDDDDRPTFSCPFLSMPVDNDPDLDFSLNVNV